jgi:hypothetical protein
MILNAAASLRCLSFGSRGALHDIRAFDRDADTDRRDGLTLFPLANTLPIRRSLRAERRHDDAGERET